MHTRDGDTELSQELESVPPSPARPARLHPFRGLRLAPAKVADPSAARALARPYREVARRLASWQSEGLMELDDVPALYLHEYTVHGITIRGLVGALDLSTRATTLEDSAVLPHEDIHSAQAGDLASRMYEMGLDPAPILLVHRGPTQIRTLIRDTAATLPDHEFRDGAGQEHRVWRLRDARQLETIAHGLADSTLLIADGHHRYAAYLELQEARYPGWDRGLAMVVDQEDTPLFLGAIHRVLHQVPLDAVAQAAAATGRVTRNGDRMSALAKLGPRSVVATDGESWLSIEWSVDSEQLSPLEHLHGDVLPRLRSRAGHGASGDASSPRLSYHHSVDSALEGLHGKHVAVLLPAPDFELVNRTVQRGRLLPEKATSFQPKPSLGVIMRPVPHTGA
ncbi:DUF1015 family protein [Nocardioides houyundeii]|uniref:DUF1015 family protein n=1 Tax=Nocardioides houyundeii TaxID=2045452 RepID=UPI000DF32A3E|nr:DUF1015 family protein [Nocardioides houyundeii]